MIVKTDSATGTMAFKIHDENQLLLSGRYGTEIHLFINEVDKSITIKNDGTMDPGGIRYDILDNKNAIFENIKTLKAK